MLPNMPPHRLVRFSGTSWDIEACLSLRPRNSSKANAERWGVGLGRNFDINGHARFNKCVNCQVSPADGFVSLLLEEESRLGLHSSDRDEVISG